MATHTTKIPAPLESIALNKEVASAAFILDHLKGKTQEELNTLFDSMIVTCEEAAAAARHYRDEMIAAIGQLSPDQQEAIALAVTVNNLVATMSHFTKGGLYSINASLKESEYQELEQNDDIIEDMIYITEDDT